MKFISSFGNFLWPSTRTSRNRSISALHFMNVNGRGFSNEEKSIVTENEIREVLSKKFPGTKSLKVEDTSGGCGEMFNIALEATEFKGLSIPQQHKAVYKALNEQILKIHGLHITTFAPK